MIGDYFNAVSERYYDHASGTTGDTVTVPSDAWVTCISFAAGGDDPATLIITPAGKSAKDTITLPVGGSFDQTVFDRGMLAGATLVFADTIAFYVGYARSTPPT